jgi:hypothetical protein
MQRKVLSLITAIVLLSAASNALGGWILWHGGYSDNWNDVDNWITGFDGGGNPIYAGRLPDWNDMVGIGSHKDPTGYWPTIYNTPDGYGYSGYAELLAMSEWHGCYSEMTIDGGLFWQSPDKYVMIGRHTDDTCKFTIKSGGVAHSRFFIIGGNGPGDAGGVVDFTMESGTVTVDALEVDRSGGNGSATAVIKGGVIDVGYDFFEPSFKIYEGGSMDLQGDTQLSLLPFANGQQNWDWTTETVQVRGNLNIASLDVDIIVNEFLLTADDVLNYLGYTDSSMVFHQGNLTVFGNPASDSNLIITPLGPSSTLIEGIPEPATICLLGLGGLALIRRKRK